MRNSFIILCSIVILVACQSRVEQPAISNINLDSLFNAYHHFKLEINPVEATKAGENDYNDYVANYISDSYISKLSTSYISFLATIADAEKQELSDAERLTLDVMKWDCEIKLQGLRNELVTIPSPVFDLPHFQLMPIGQISSFHLYFNQLGSGESLQPFETEQDYENWLKRVSDYVIWVDTAIENLQKGLDKNVVWPKPLIEKMIVQVEGLQAKKTEDHLFYKPVQDFPKSFAPVDKGLLENKFKAMIEEELEPAHGRLLAFLKDIYLPSGADFTGLSQQPGGSEAYQYLIKYHTTTNLTPDEIFDLGMSEVKRISAEMEDVKKQVGFEGDLKAFFDHVRSSPEQMPFTNPSQVIANFEAIHNKMTTQIGNVFDAKPKAGFEIKRTEAFREASASPEYYPGAKDGSRPGVFYVPIPDVKAYNKYASEALFLHEAIPGHHYQLSLQQENEDLPEFLHSEGMGVFVEGWALYAESLGKELGLYDDPYQYFGMLSMEMHRAIRLVVDAGMHAKGWTREEAIQFSLDHEADSEASITAEIERYMVMPGQALSYKMGQLKIRELRTRAEKELGENFDIKAFHNQVLGSGSLPLILLEEKIDKWIAATKK